MRFGLSDSTIEKISNVLAQYPQIESAILYGSRAKGNYKHGSDIDLTLLGDSDLTLSVLYRVMDELDDLLLPYTIDLSIFANINDANVRAHIERVGMVFYKRGWRWRRSDCQRMGKRISGCVRMLFVYPLSLSADEGLTGLAVAE